MDRHWPTIAGHEIPMISRLFDFLALSLLFGFGLILFDFNEFMQYVDFSFLLMVQNEKWPEKFLAEAIVTVKILDFFGTLTSGLLHEVLVVLITPVSDVGRLTGRVCERQQGGEDEGGEGWWRWRRHRAAPSSAAVAAAVWCSGSSTGMQSSRRGVRDPYLTSGHHQMKGKEVEFVCWLVA